jgi:hypothetical protein
MNEQPVASERNGHGHVAHRLVSWNLAVIGGGFAYFSYIDAPITDAAMWMFGGAVAISLLSLIFALLGADAGASVHGARARRIALLLFVGGLALLLMTATLTMNLKGTATDDDDTQTAGVSRA